MGLFFVLCERFLCAGVVCMICLGGPPPPQWQHGKTNSALPLFVMLGRFNLLVLLRQFYCFLSLYCIVFPFILSDLYMMCETDRDKADTGWAQLAGGGQYIPVHLGLRRFDDKPVRKKKSQQVDTIIASVSSVFEHTELSLKISLFDILQMVFLYSPKNFLV